MERALRLELNDQVALDDRPAREWLCGDPKSIAIIMKYKLEDWPQMPVKYFSGQDSIYRAYLCGLISAPLSGFDD
ncbi:hypothetical protein bcgnr5380_57180 [Bacillus cereus]